MACSKICIGALKTPIEIVRRSLLSAAPGTADPVHNYTPVFAVRAEVKTKGGTSEIARVEINGERVSHVMTIRYTALAFDTRDRVRDMAGVLYAILAVENIDEENRWMKLYCARRGDETAAAVR